MHIGRKMLKLGKVEKGENMVDIGCGDGRLVYMAANEIGAKATGYELSPIVYAIAKIRQLFW
ncbi:class I SAM-dependent methyltransferase [bacterium]|nr:class I SAM-dependent methyltransferase [bacterium]